MVCVAPPAGFEPAHPPPEGGALSPELWGLAHLQPTGLSGLAEQGYQAQVSPDTDPMCTHAVPIADNLAP
jgi:hypothetical protein